MRKWIVIIVWMVLAGGVTAGEVRSLNQQILDSLWLVMEQEKDEAMSVEKAMTIRKYAYTAEKMNRIEEAQVYAQQAQEMLMELGRPDLASLCLYERCIAYESIGDSAHLHVLLRELEELAQTDTSALTQFNYYSILFAWRMQITMAAEEITETMREEVRIAGERSIRALEQIPNPKEYNILSAWNYYNQALVFDFLYTPSLTDSIAYYLDRAEEAVSRAPSALDRQEVMVSVNDLRAWIYYYDNEFTRAEKQMMEVIAMIDTIAIHSPGTVISERGEAYAFLVELYERQGRYEEALHYQQLLTDNNAERYSTERQRILDDVQTRYEVAQKELEIERQKRLNTMIISGLIMAILAIIALIAGMIALQNKKKRREEELYAKAMEAENRYNELVASQQMVSTEPLEILREGLLLQIHQLPDKMRFKSEAMQRMEALNLSVFASSIAEASALSVMDKRYLMCFAAGMSAEQIADLFSISPASVYTVRYRIKKKNTSLRDIF